jgi:hypothetical protein
MILDWSNTIRQYPLTGTARISPCHKMSHLLLAPSGRDVFNSAASPSFDLPSSFLSIETIVSSHSALAPSTLFEHTTLALVEHPTSHYCIRCACSAGRIRRIAGQYLRLILSFLHLVMSSIPPSDRTFYPWHLQLVPPSDRACTPPLLPIDPPLDTFAPHLRQDGSNAARISTTLCAASVSRPRKEYIP